MGDVWVCLTVWLIVPYWGEVRTPVLKLCNVTKCFGANSNITNTLLFAHWLLCSFMVNMKMIEVNIGCLWGYMSIKKRSWWSKQISTYANFNYQISRFWLANRKKVCPYCVWEESRYVWRSSHREEIRNDPIRMKSCMHACTFGMATPYKGPSKRTNRT